MENWPQSFAEIKVKEGKKTAPIGEKCESAAAQSRSGKRKGTTHVRAKEDVFRKARRAKTIVMT